jgi:hypothetical protein
MARFNAATVQAKIVGASGTTAVVAAQGAGKSIYVLRLTLFTDTDCTVKFQSASTDISGVMTLAARAGWRDGMARTADDPMDCLFRTQPNEALNLVQSTAAVLGGYLTYFVA